MLHSGLVILPGQALRLGSHGMEERTGQVNINTERDGGALVVKTEGRIDGSNASDFQGAVEAEISSDDKSLILDFEQLDYISSAGLRVILLIAKDLQQKGIKFAICSLSTLVREVFMISGFDQIIEVYDNPAAASSAWQG